MVCHLQLDRRSFLEMCLKYIIPMKYFKFGEPLFVDTHVGRCSTISYPLVGESGWILSKRPHHQHNGILVTWFAFALVLWAVLRPMSSLVYSLHRDLFSIGSAFHWSSVSQSTASTFFWLLVLKLSSFFDSLETKFAFVRISLLISFQISIILSYSEGKLARWLGKHNHLDPSSVGP